MTRALLITLLFAGCRDDAPCTIEPGGLDFGEVEATAIAPQARFVKVSNPSSVDRTCTIEPLDAPFGSDPKGELVVKGLAQSLITVTFRPQDGLLHHQALVLSSPDGGCDLAVRLQGLGSGRLRATPEQLEFTLGRGAVETKSLQIENTRRTPDFVTVAFGGPAGPFRVNRSQAAVPAHGSVPVSITAAPGTWSAATASLHLRGDTQLVIVPLVFVPLSPRLGVSPLAIDVPRVGVGQFVERSFRLSNVGTSGDPSAPPLVFPRGPGLTLGDVQEVDVVPLRSFSLAEGESTEFTVRVEPLLAGPRSFRFRITPSPEFLSPIEVALTAVAEVLPPCEMQVDPIDVLQLQDAADGGVEGRVTFTNTGTTLCIVDNPRLKASQFSLMTSRGEQVEVAAGRSHVVTIAGPKLPDAGSVGAFGFHVFRDGGAQEWIDLRSP